MNNPIRRTKPEKTGVNAPLGDLEQMVMRRVWDCGPAGVLGSDIHGDLDKTRPIALTTVLTTLDRLRDKGILRRERDGKAYRYWATVAENELQQRIVGGVLDRLIAQFPSAVAAYFSQETSANKSDETATLTELARQIGDIETKAALEGGDGR